MEAAGPREHSIALTGEHKVLVATLVVMVPCSRRQADCGDVTMALMALMADTLGGCVTHRNDERVAQPIRLLVALPYHSFPNTKGRGSGLSPNYTEEQLGIGKG